MNWTGHCLCGATRWEATRDPTWACHCHCESCRRATGAPMTSFLGFQLADFRWTGPAPTLHASSAGVARGHCPTCGTPMSFQAEWYVGEIHVYAATQADPTRFAPEFHVHWSKKLPWLMLNDDLPKHPHSAPEEA